MAGDRSLLRTMIAAAFGLAAISTASAQDAAQRLADARALAAQCRIAEALPAAERALAVINAEYGAATIEAAFALDEVGKSAAALGRFDRATEAGRRAVEIASARGKQSLEYAVMLGNLGSSLMLAGRFDEAARAFEEAEPLVAADPARLFSIVASRRDLAGVREDAPMALALAQRAREVAGDLGPPERAAAVSGLAMAQIRMGDLTGAEQTLSGAADNRGLDVARAQLASAQGDLASAERLILSIRDRATVGGGDCDVLAIGSAENALADIYLLRREALEARQALQRALDLYDRRGFSQPHRIATVYHNLALAARYNGESEESGRLFDRAAALYDSAFGVGSVRSGRVLSEKAIMLAEAGKGAAAVDAARRGLAVIEKSAKSNARDKANAWSALGFAQLATKNAKAAQDSFQKAVASFAVASGPDHVDLAPGLTELGAIESAAGSPGAAEHLSRALDIQRKAGATSGVGMGRTSALLAKTMLDRGEVSQASVTIDEAVAGLLDRLAIHAGAGSARDVDDLRRARTILETALDVASASKAADRGERAFLAAQLAVSTRTGQALAQTVDRFASQDPRVRELVRDRQALSRKWQDLDRIPLPNAGLAATPTAAAARVKYMATRTDISAQIAGLDRRIREADPTYGPLLSNRPVEAEATQAKLGNGEALLLYVLGNDESWAVVVTRERLDVVALPVSTSRVTSLARGLRDSLDMDAWPSSENPKPYNVSAAHALYKALIAPLEPLLAGKDRWLIVPDGGLAGVPVGALLKSPAAIPRTPQAYRALDWVASDKLTILTLPSASAVVGLRFKATRSSATLAFFGVGDPALGSSQAFASRGIRVKPIQTGAEPIELMQLPSLPETRDELVSIAAALGERNAPLLLGQQANEIELSRRDLKSYRWLAFATHGVLAGELPGRQEPGLILTPPRRATPENDGYFSASEIARLELDADLVILSACNTAGSDGAPDAEGLSGLARAFILAGARAVLVTHWKVDSEAARILIPDVVRRHRQGTDIAAALVQAEVALRSHPSYRWSGHPAFWAPFSYVGVGS